MKSLKSSIQESLRIGINDNPEEHIIDDILEICCKIFNYSENSVEFKKIKSKLKELIINDYELHYYTEEEEISTDILSGDMIANAVEETKETWQQLIDAINVKGIPKNSISFTHTKDKRVYLCDSYIYFKTPKILFIFLFS